jgi:hypothetical protein
MVDGMEQSTAVQCSESDAGALNATGAYETQSGVVLYDTEAPLAWIQGDNAVSLAEMT